MSQNEHVEQDAADVVVVGGGAAGLMAAIEARDAGASVVLLQKLSAAGGMTTWSIGSVIAGGTALQAERGIDDSRELHRADMRSWTNLVGVDNPAARRLDFFVDHGPAVIERLLELGVELNGPHPEGMHSRYRTHVLSPNSIGAVAVLGQQALERGVRMRWETPVTGLVQDETGRVVGVETGERRVAARKGVILATGDYSAARDGIQPPPGSRLSFREWTTGDGQFMAAEAGANTFGTTEPLRLDMRTVDWPYIKPEPPLYGEGAILVTRSGRRIANELSLDPYALTAECDEDLFVVFDRRVLDRIATAADDSPHARDGWYRTGKLFACTFPGLAYAYVDDLVRVGHAAKADSLEGVASALGIDAGGLADEAEAAKGADRFGRPASSFGLDRPPFVAIGPCRYRSFSGMATIECDLKMRVLRPDGEPIPGLYAAGNLSGRASSGGSHGFGLGWAFMSGMMAGIEAAAAPDTA